jgi:hypothetical protein
VADGDSVGLTVGGAPEWVRWTRFEMQVRAPVEYF